MAAITDNHALKVQQCYILGNLITHAMHVCVCVRQGIHLVVSHWEETPECDGTSRAGVEQATESRSEDKGIKYCVSAKSKQI